MKSPLIHLAIALVICALALSGYGLAYRAILTKTSDIAALDGSIAAKTASINHLTTTRAALSEITSYEEAIQSYFVSENGVVGFIDNLEALGRAQGTKVNVLSVSPDSGAQQSALGFSISITGTFDAVMRTVGAIEYAPYAISISTLSVGQDAKNAWHADLAFRVGSIAGATATSTP